MSQTSTLVATAAGRYATALFQLALESNALERTEADLAALRAALTASADLRMLIASPLFSRDDQARGMAGVAAAMDLAPMTRNVIGLMAQKRRIAELPHVITMFGALLAEHQGVVEAEVTAARALSKGQVTALTKALKAAVGKNIKLTQLVDDSLIAGVVVKVGSKMIDTSVRTKLANLKIAMKEVG